MCLFSVNVPDNRATLSAINGHLYDIAQNTKQMGYSLERIKKDMIRVADASEVIAGIVSKEEIIAKKRYDELLHDYACMDEYNDYENWSEAAKKEHDDKQAELRRIERFLEKCKDHRTDFLLKEEEK